MTDGSNDIWQARDEIVRETYAFLDPIWTTIDNALDRASGVAPFPDAVWDSAYSFFQKTYYAVTKRSFEVSSPDSVDELRGVAEEVRSTGLEIAILVRQTVARVRVSQAKRELDKHWLNLAINTESTYDYFDKANVELEGSESKHNEGALEEALDLAQRSFDSASAAIAEIQKRRRRVAGQRLFRISSWLLTTVFVIVVAFLLGLFFNSIARVLF